MMTTFLFMANIFFLPGNFIVDSVRIRSRVTQTTNTLHMARLLQIDVECVAKFAFVRGNLSKRIFSLKHTDFYPCPFSETGQRPCSYL